MSEEDNIDPYPELSDSVEVEDEEFSDEFEADLLDMREEEEPPVIEATAMKAPAPKLDPTKFGNMKKNDLVEQCLKTKDFVPKYKDHNKTWFRDKKVGELKEILVDMTDYLNKEVNETYVDTSGKRVAGSQGELLFMVHQMLIVSAEGYAEMHKDKMKGISISGLSDDLEKHREELGNILAENLEYLTGWSEADLQYFLTPPLKYAMFMLKVGNGRIMKNKIEEALKKT